MKVLLLNGNPLTFTQANDLRERLKANYPEIYVLNYIDFPGHLFEELHQESRDVLLFATAFQCKNGFSGPYTGVLTVRDFPVEFLKQNSEYSLVEYSKK